MKNILTVFKKEWDRVIKDRRLVLMVILLPGLLIFTIYSVMGTVINNQTEPMANIAIVNEPASFTDFYSSYENLDNLTVKEITASEIADYENLIDNKEWTMVISFPEDIENYDGLGDKPVVYIYYNVNDLDSSNTVNRFTNYLQSYEKYLSELLFSDRVYFNLVQSSTEMNENEIMGSVLSQLLPMLVIMFLFSGAMSIGPEAIAGEKERGTISTILITPVKRSEIAMGKILGLSVLSLLSAVSSFLGIILSLPKLMNYEGANIAIYGLGQYLLILLILFSTIFVIVGIISILSAYAKSVKEASAYIMPIYILTIIVSISTSFSSMESPNILLFIVPIFNSVQSLRAILTFSDQALIYTLITVFANIIYLGVFIYILNKMFNSEKIMFAK